MRHSLLPLLCALTASVSAQLHRAEYDFSLEPYYIERFFVEIQLRANATMRVKETIQVRFNQSRRGIFRLIPVDYQTRTGTTRRVLIDVIGVEDGLGKPLTTKITKEGENLKIRIGDENILLPPGTKMTYVITYEAAGMINWFEDPADWQPYAELHWNVTGDQWDVPIATSGFRIEFPRSPGAEGLRARVFAGPYGSTDQVTQNNIGSQSADNPTHTDLTVTETQASGLRTMPLYPGEGLTVVINLPANLIQKLPLWQVARLTILPNLGFALPLITLIGMFILWWRYGKDPYGGPVVVQYDPPDGVTGPEAGALIDERVDRRDVGAGIVSLAVKGYLNIEFGDEEGLIFKRRPWKLKPTKKAPSDDLTSFETALLNAIEECGDEATEKELRNKVAPILPKLQTELYQSLVRRGYYQKSPDAVRNAWFVAGLFTIIALGILVTLLSPFKNPLPAVVGGIISLVFIGSFAQHMPLRTKAGAIAHKNAMGFEEFIRRARGQELDWMTKKHPSAALFEAYLPHAVAFGLTEEWAQAFKDVLVEPPNWYRTPSGTGFNPAWFASDFDSVTNDIATAAGTPPRSAGASGGSSGFGGGGFSGGGFGGGGGGSW